MVKKPPHTLDARDDEDTDAAAKQKLAQLQNLAQTTSTPKVKKEPVPATVAPPPAMLAWLALMTQSVVNSSSADADAPLKVDSSTTTAPIEKPASPDFLTGLLPTTGSTGNCYTGLKSFAPAEAHANRQAPPGLDQMVRKGDVAYFDGNHAQMCVGKTADGKAIWCSDTNQGTNFFVNNRCQDGSFVIYRPDSHFDVDRGVKNLLAHANTDYTHECAKYVRAFGINGGLGAGEQLQGQPSTAAGYVADGSSLRQVGFTMVAQGGANGFTAHGVTSVARAHSAPGVFS